MTFSTALTIALAACVAGIGYRVARWFRLSIGPPAEHRPTSARIAAALKAVPGVFRPASLWRGLRSLVCDVVLQLHLLRRSPLRWAMHMALFYGCALLIAGHALDDPVTRNLFPGYEPTLAPFLLARNLLGLLLLAGVLVAAARRLAARRSAFFTTAGDWVTLILLGALALSGFALEAVQIGSEPIFDEMVVDYSGEEDPAVVEPLRAFWAAEFGLVTARPVNSADEVVLQEGRETHATYCAECHSPPRSAFVSYSAATALKPVAAGLNRHRADLWLWHLHYLLAFAGLAWLPFSKLFHLAATPMGLLAGRPTESGRTTPAGRLNRRALALDACTHCGVCSRHCSVAPIFALIENRTVLPSEKLLAMKSQAGSAGAGHQDLACLSEGSFICTECTRCTTLCPSGIDLQDLWRAGKRQLHEAGYPAIHARLLARPYREWIERIEKNRPASGPQAATGRHVNLADRRESFVACVQCTTCTSVCPVVAVARDPAAELDLTPQQIMNLLRMGMKDTALGARMVWKCVTCYQCQEHCPQDVKVADVLYELRNIAWRRLDPCAAARRDPKTAPPSEGRAT